MSKPNFVVTKNGITDYPYVASLTVGGFEFVDMNKTPIGAVKDVQDKLIGMRDEIEAVLACHIPDIELAWEREEAVPEPEPAISPTDD